MLVGLLSELTHERKQRSRSINELSRRLYSKLDQTNQLIATESKIRGETYRKLQQMHSDLGERMKGDLNKLTRERREGSDGLLRML